MNPIDNSTFLPEKLTKKNPFEENLEKLDLQGVLIMLTILSERALYLQSKDLMDKKTVIKAESKLVL